MEIRDIELKCRSKHEFYLKFSGLCNLYLPRKWDINNNYISDIRQDRKKKALVVYPILGLCKEVMSELLTFQDYSHPILRSSQRNM